MVYLLVCCHVEDDDTATVSGVVVVFCRWQGGESSWFVVGHTIEQLVCEYSVLIFGHGGYLCAGVLRYGPIQVHFDFWI
jgi:hypothetical protein